MFFFIIYFQNIKQYFKYFGLLLLSLYSKYFVNGNYKQNVEK